MTGLDKRERVRPGDKFMGGRLRYMAHAKGYVMVRRPGCIPFVMDEKDWLALPISEGQK